MLSLLKTELHTWRLISSLFIDRFDTERFANENQDETMLFDQSVCCSRKAYLLLLILVCKKKRGAEKRENVRHWQEVEVSERSSLDCTYLSLYLFPAIMLSSDMCISKSCYRKTGTLNLNFYVFAYLKFVADTIGEYSVVIHSFIIDIHNNSSKSLFLFCFHCSSLV